MNNRIIEYAKKTFLAMQNPYGSIDYVFPLAINAFKNKENPIYFGVKNVKQVPISLLRKLIKEGYVLHTLDKSSRNGRAVDYFLMNPITGNKMTGSSSGTALNVFLGINDFGVGLDGGGSVLAPAMALQLFSFISPLLETEKMKQHLRKSTDNISFNPSIGFITRDLGMLERLIESSLCIQPANGIVRIHIPANIRIKKIIKEKVGIQKSIGFHEVNMPEFGNDRNPMLVFLSEQIKECDVFVSYESKIDVNALGDSVLGHFDQEMQMYQRRSGKYLIRVANMAQASALTVPTSELASGFTLFCESTPEKIAKMLQIARLFVGAKDELVERYFRDPDSYFREGVFCIDNE